MATIIWCDRVKHVVSESRTEVAALIDAVQTDLDNRDITGVPGGTCDPRGFAYFTVVPHQRALNVRLISSFEAAPRDSI